ncbi:MAG: hypothetical protein RL514_1328 [Verrucomicrobiota bacterium]|jgi:hypothetical protein
MTWFYAVGSERKGPVTEAELDRLAAQGELRSDTLVWRDGMADWKPLAEARPAAAAGQPPKLSTAVSVACSGCRGVFTRDNVVPLDGSFFCAACKPAAVQRLQEGVVTPLGDAEAVRNEHLKHEASIRSVGSLYYVGGVAVVFAAIALFITGLTADRNSPEAGIGVILGGGFLGFLGALQLWTAHGLRCLKPSARTPATLFSCLGLLGFPIGTLINGYILYLLHSKKGRTVMTAEYAQVIAQTPHIKYKTSVIVWIFLGLVVALLVLGMVAAVTSRR